MARKSMKSALNASLKAEDEAVKSRFEKAESLLGEKPQQASDQLIASAPDVPDVREQIQRERVIRDSFSLPSGDYDLIAAIRQRCLRSAINVTKSEVVRAGLHALVGMPGEELVELMSNLEKVKTGRPSKKV